MPQLESYLYFQEYVMGGICIFFLYYLFRWYILPLELFVSYMINYEEFNQKDGPFLDKSILIKLLGKATD